MTIRLQHAFLVITTLVLFLSCGNKYESIDLDKVDPALKAHVDKIATDFIELVRSNQMWVFAKKGYITPMVHTGINSPYGIYSQAPYQLKEELGGNIRLKLVKVLNRKLLYSFSYEVHSTLADNGTKKLMFDINKDRGLAKIHFFIKNDGQFNTEKEWVDLFSDDVFLRK